MDFSKIKKAHFIGIGGIGVSAVAKYFLSLKASVSGSDVYKSEITESLIKRGIKVFYESQEKNLEDGVELVVYSPAVPATDPERLKAENLGVPCLSYPEFLGMFSANKKTIAVAGTNGKSTTAAMVGKILEAAGFDPTVIVGTQVPGFDGNLRVGKSDWLVVEACEWKAHMLNLNPQIIVLTDLVLDHTDFYKDIHDLKRRFQNFIDKLPLERGLLAFNADDDNLQSLIKEKGYQVLSWAMFNKTADNQAQNIKLVGQKQEFMVGESVFELPLPGLYNIYNALSAITIARHLGIKDEVSAASLARFTGCWRRFETLGNLKGFKDVAVISDYAHHPKALKSMLKGAREFYPGKRLTAVFQPHHYDRTAKLFEEFKSSFHGADVVILSDIYDVAGRQNDGERAVTSKDLVEAMKKEMPAKEIIYSGSLRETEKTIKNEVKEGDLLLMIGAGDIDELARKLV